MRKSLLFTMLAIIISSTSCKKTDDPTIEIPTQFATVKLEEGQNSKTITFSSNQSWTADVKQTKSDDASWLTISPTSGDPGDGTITINVDDNFAQTDRTAYIHITIDGLSRSISVTQTQGIPNLVDDQPLAKVESNGFYVANEDWFGHDNGTINYFSKDGANYTPAYRVYRAANPSESDWLGVTTQFATIWGDNMYICSKQGNRLVVADAKTLKKKAIFETIGGDGRMFIGVDDKKGYVGHSSGIVVFDIANLKLAEPIAGVSGQIGSMCLSAGRVFAISQQNGVYVINATTNKVEQTISGSYNTITSSKDGNVWIASSAKLIKLNPITLEKEEMDYPDALSIASPWGAWNAGSLCASTQNNVIYWYKGANVVKYDIDTKTANTTFYTLGKSEFGTQLAFYGAGMRVDPLTDELILTVRHGGWGAAGAFNWIYKLNADGHQITNFKVRGDDGSAESWGGNATDWDGKYFWFPAIPLFEDANKPQVVLNQILVETTKQTTIDLTEKIVDYDNTLSSMLITVNLEENNLVGSTLEGNKLTVTAGNSAGSTACTVRVVSNGVLVEKKVRVDVVRN